LLNPDPSLTGGLILVAASPIAAMSNYYALLARANVALAVTLTAISSLLALFTAPLIAAVSFQLLLVQTATIHLPVGKTMQQVMIGLVLPIVAGMAIRHIVPGWTARNRIALTRLSLAALAILVAYVLFDQAAVIARGLAQLVLAAVLFTCAAVGSGYLVSRLLRQHLAERTVITIGFGIRNLTVAIMIGTTVLGRLDFVAFGAVFFLSQLVLIAPFIAWSRRQSGAQPSPPPVACTR
jgi:BASS family bile acid:Na+ symporter